MERNNHVCVKTEELAKLRTQFIIVNTHMIENRKEIESMKALLLKLFFIGLSALVGAVVTLLLNMPRL